MTDMTVANTILRQLGGGQFTAMTGAKYYTGDANSLGFRIGGGATKNINYVKIVLNGRDLYDVTYSRVTSKAITEVASTCDIYADNLREDFTAKTGFYTSL